MNADRPVPASGADHQRGGPSAAPLVERAVAAETRASTRIAGIAQPASQLFGAMVALVPIVVAMDLPRRLGFVLYTEQMILVVLGFALATIYLTVPASGGRRSGPVPVWDWALGLAGAAAAIYFAADFDDVVAYAPYRPLDILLLSGTLIVTTVEALRRAAGWPITIVVLAFFLYAFFGMYLPGALAGLQVNYARLVIYMAIDPSALLGSPLQVAVGTVVLFILFGQFLQQSYGALFFNDLAVSMMGRFRGGSGKIAIASGALFGTISGSAVANVVVSGTITIPMMRKAGYRPENAAAVEAVSSTGGQLVPPVMGAAAFLMAEFLQVPYTTIVLAAIIPAALFYLANIIYVDLAAARDGIRGEDPSRIPSLLWTLLRGLHFVLPFVVLVVALFHLNQPVATSALAACVTIILISQVVPYRGNRLRPSDILRAISATGVNSLEIIIVCAAAGFVIGVINVTGIGFGLTLQLVTLAEKNLLLLLAIAAVLCVVLGMGMPTTGVYVLLATVIVPGLIESGVQPLSAHMFVLYLGMMSMITPPVALAAFTAATLAGCPPLRAGWAAVKLGWTAFVVPFLFIYQPALLMQGTTAEILIAMGFTAIGIGLGTMAVVGYGFQGTLLTPQRLLYAVAAAGFLSPSADFATNFGYAALGLLIAAAGFAVEYWRKRRRLETASS